MDARRKILFSPVYWVRIACGGFTILSSSWPLLLLAHRHTRVVKEFQSELRRQDVSIRRLPNFAAWRIYLRLYGSLPWLAGHSGRRTMLDFEELWQTYTLGKKSTGEPETLEAEPLIRDLQGIYVEQIFRLGLRLPVKKEQAYALAHYADSTVLVNDFLIFCREVHFINGATTTDALQKALAGFLGMKFALVTPAVRSGREERPGIFPLIPKFLLFNRSLGRFYNSRLVYTESEAYHGARSWILDLMDNHLDLLAGHSSNEFSAVLRNEIHRHACGLLCEAAAAAGSEPTQQTSRAVEEAFANLLHNLESFVNSRPAEDTL